MRLGPCVNWTEEKACFHTFLKELADFYTPPQIPDRTREAEDELPEEAQFGDGALIPGAEIEVDRDSGFVERSG